MSKEPEVLVIPADEKPQEIEWSERQIRVAAYCRVSTDDDEQLTSFEAQKNYYTAKYFEKENINTLEAESEMMLTIMGTFAQAESESISRNVAWGKRQAMKSGKVMSFNRIYGYSQDEDSEPKIVSEEAEVVKRIFDWYLAGASVAQIIDRLAEENIPTPTNNKRWTQSTLRTLIQNEKYCGDVLQQKTFVADVLTKRIVKNNRQLPKYLIKNYHEPIICREIFYKVQTEYKRRSAQPAESQTIKSNYHRYSSMYALTNIMICGECRTPYRRAVWKKRSGKRQPVWRCTNRLDNGKRYCKQSPTIQEYALQDAILNAIKENFKPEDWLIAYNVPQKLAKRQWSHQDSDDNCALKDSLMVLLGEDTTASEFSLLLKRTEAKISRLQDVSASLHDSLSQNYAERNELCIDAQQLEWNETMVRNLASKVIVQNENHLVLKFKNGKQAVLVLGGQQF